MKIRLTLDAKAVVATLLDKARLAQRLARRLRDLGYEVQLNATAA